MKARMIIALVLVVLAGATDAFGEDRRKDQQEYDYQRAHRQLVLRKTDRRVAPEVAVAADDSCRRGWLRLFLLFLGDNCAHDYVTLVRRTGDTMTKLTR